MGKKEDEKIAPHCDFMFVHEEVVKQVMEVMPHFRGLYQDSHPLCLKPVGALRL